jgi:hypothetical protein
MALRPGHSGFELAAQAQAAHTASCQVQQQRFIHRQGSESCADLFCGLPPLWHRGPAPTTPRRPSVGDLCFEGQRISSSQNFSKCSPHFLSDIPLPSSLAVQVGTVSRAKLLSPLGKNLCAA